MSDLFYNRLDLVFWVDNITFALMYATNIVWCITFLLAFLSGTYSIIITINDFGEAIPELFLACYLIVFSTWLFKNRLKELGK